MVELRQSKTDQTTGCIGSFLSVSFHITYRRIKSVFYGFVKFCRSNKMWKILVYIFLLTLIFGNIGYLVWQKQVSSKNTVHFKRKANRSMCGSKKLRTRPLSVEIDCNSNPSRNRCQNQKWITYCGRSISGFTKITCFSVWAFWEVLDAFHIVYG